MKVKQISRREALKRIFTIFFGIGLIGFFAKNVFGDVIFRGKDGSGTLEFLLFNETTGLTTIGKEGDTQIGTANLSNFIPNTDLKINYGTTTNRPNDVHVGGDLVIGPTSELTISGGVITVIRSSHTVDTESDAASDDLDTINGSQDGMFLVISAADSARTVVVKDGTGNLDLAGDFSMDHVDDTLFLQLRGTNWKELTRSNNA